MAVVRIFAPENRLAKTLTSMEAPTAAELTAEAEGRVAGLRDAIRTYVAEKQKVIAGYAAAGDDVLFGECRVLGEAALNVAEVAGAAGLETVGEIARGISAMVDGLLANGVWHSDALRLHIRALALASQLDETDPPAGALMLRRLRTMRETLGIVE